MADFANVTSTFDQASGTVSLHGKARGPKATPVHITETVTAEDGTSETLETDGVREVVSDLAVNYTSVTDDQGGVYAIAADGQSAKIQA